MCWTWTASSECRGGRCPERRRPWCTCALPACPCACSPTPPRGAEPSSPLGSREYGFAFSDDEVLNAAAAAGAYPRAERAGACVFLLGDGQAADLEGVELVGLHEDPYLIPISGANDSFTFENLNRVYRALLAGAELVAMHRNLPWMTHAGVCLLDAGAYLLGLERPAGREAVVVGKPAPRGFLGAVASLGLPAVRVAMVGDDVANDVLAAQAIGLTGVLVCTGKFREDTLAAAGGVCSHGRA